MSKKTTMKKTRPIAKVKSLVDLHSRATKDERYQRLCIVAARNLGCEPRQISDRETKWRAHYQELINYVTALVSEYGGDEDKAFRDVCEEVNFVRDCIGQAQLDW